MNSSFENPEDYDEQLWVQSDIGQFHFLESPFPLKQYDYKDLANNWLQKAPTFTCNYEWSYYQQEIYYLEFSFFFEISADPMETAVNDLSSFIKLHHDPLFIQLAILEKFITTKRKLVEAEYQLYPVSNEIVLDRLETLMLLLQSSIANSRLFTPRKKIKWAKDYSEFVEMFDIHYDTGCFSEISKKAALEICHEFIEFRTHKSPSNFSSTSSANRNKRKNPTQFYDSLKVEYRNFLDSRKL